MPRPTTQTKAQTARAPALALWRMGVGAPPAGPFVALVPGGAAPLLTVSLPDTLRGPARLDVARRQVLDRLGGKAQDLDIRAAPLGDAATWARVAVADRAQVLRWRSSMGADAARCRGLLPDYAALPTAPGLWTLAHEDGVLRVRLGPADGFSAEADLAAAMLARALDQRPRAVLWLGPRDAALEAVLGNLPVHRSTDELPADLRPASLGHGELALNFARDPQADARSLAGGVRRLLWPAVLCVLGAAAWSGAQVLATRADLAVAAQVQAQIEAAAQRDLLGAAPIVDLRLQVARAIDQHRRPAGAAAAPVTVLDLLRRGALVLSDGGLTVQSISLGAGADGVQMDVVAPDFHALDTAQEDLAQAGLQADVLQSAIAPQGGVTARVVISGVTP